MDTLALQQIPEERWLAAGAVHHEASTAEELQESWQMITPPAAAFLRYRILTTSDAEARHLLGHPRDDGSQRTCACGRHQPGWIDMRETTMHNWKKNPHFMRLYQAMLHQPVLSAAVRIQALAPAAVHNLQRLLDPNTEDVRDSHRLGAVKLVLEATGLKATEGVNRPHSGLVAAQAQEDFQLRMARERYARGLEVSAPQRQLLLDAGYELEAPGAVTVLQADRTARTLDGEDVPVVWDDGGDDNEAYLPD